MLGAFGELHPAVIDALDARPPLAGFEVFLDAVPEPRGGRAEPPVQLSVFQPIERDFAFVVDQEFQAETLLRAARGVDRKLRYRHPALRHLPGSRVAGRQEVARHYRGIAAAGADLDQAPR